MPDKDSLPPEEFLASRQDVLKYGAQALVFAVFGVIAYIMKAESRGHHIISSPPTPIPGMYKLDMAIIPRMAGAPVELPEAHTWLTNPGNGLLALDSRCPLDDCATNADNLHWQFVCSCCGSRFGRDGRYLDGPADQGMRKFSLVVERSNPNSSFLYMPSRYNGATPLDNAVAITLFAREPR